MRKGQTHSEQTKKQMRYKKLGTHRSEKTKLKIKLSLIGRKRPSRSIEWSKKISDHHKKNPLNFWKGKKRLPFSVEWKSNMRKRSLGSKSHFWKGGKMMQYKKFERIRKSIDYKLWHTAVFTRDNWTCQKTGIKGGKLQAHHIQNFADYPELRTSIENGITLCEKAHKEFHKIYGKRNNTRKQLNEFLLK